MSIQSARSEEHIDDVDAQLPRQDVLIPPSSWSPSTPHRHFPSGSDVAILLPSAVVHQRTASTTAPAIRPHRSTFTNNNGQDVLPLSVDSRPPQTQSSIYSHGFPHRHLESSTLPSSTFAPHGPVNAHTPRLRTNHPVFGTTTKLAEHYGIPTKLPPIPRVNNNNISSNRPPVPRFHEASASASPAPPASSSSSHAVSFHHQQPISNTANEITDFQSLMAGYMNMLNNKSDENGAANNAAPVPESPAQTYAGEPSAEEAAQSISNALFGGAGDFTSSAWDEYLTSPFLDDESPFESLLETPASAPGMHDFFNSPLVADSSMLGSNDPLFADIPLFPGYAAQDTFSKMSLAAGVSPSTVMAPPPSTPANKPMTSFDNLYTMSPATPALEPSSTQTSPLVTDMASISPNPAATVSSGASASGRKKKSPTGTRKNITPDALVPLEAPTQPRTYVMPSTTSRKALPAVFARKRSRSAAFGADADAEEDELAAEEAAAAEALEALPANATEAEQIAAKRRQNTLAARRSRKRKLEYQRELEEGIENERREKEMWRERAIMLRTQVMQLGMPEPFREA